MQTHCDPYLCVEHTLRWIVHLHLVQRHWLPSILQRSIPITPGISPMDMLTDESTKVL